MIKLNVEVKTVKGFLRGVKNSSYATKLEKKVATMVNEASKDDVKSYIRDIVTYGCICGIVGELIYYSDTTKFYNRYKNDIEYILRQCSIDFGINDICKMLKINEESFITHDEIYKEKAVWFTFEHLVWNYNNHMECLGLM